MSDSNNEGAASAALSAAERSKYQRIWELPEYSVNSPGLRHLPDALTWMRPEAGASITDWGSGSGKASDELHRLGFAVRMVDIAPNAYKGELPVIEACLWELPESLGSTDYGYCADVMEHIPAEKVEAVLAAIAQRTRVACYFQIALFHDHYGKKIGESLHLSVFPAEWWHDRLRAVFAHCEFQGSESRHVLALCRHG